MDWSFDPLQLAPLVLVGGFYARRARTLRRRGAPVAGWRRFSFGLGLLLAVVALASPLHSLGEERLFSAHMLQHVLLGDLAALALVAGLTGPILRPVLAVPLFGRLRVLAHPLVALPLWAVNLYAWHFPALYEAALSSGAVHALEHVLFLACGALMWAPVIEVLPGPVWFGTGAKLGYIVVVRLLETLLGNVLFWTGSVLYSTYER
ncbi:MAG: cytochrome c oxidase assembly protein, partial [Gaiellaceae bacterium]